MSVLLVPDGLDGERVDVAAARMSGVSRSRISSLIEDGGVFLDGQQVSRASVRVATGQMLDVDLCDPVATPSITPQIVEGMRIIRVRVDHIATGFGHFFVVVAQDHALVH